ncbi:MAG: hypothetical protein HGA72_03555 [Chlorobiaceae bacterium]|nr:hypothetical protein [Chlorobiaceae bacterium]
MNTICSDLKNPFGFVSCEEEEKVLQDMYSDFFFWETPFNDPTLDKDTYLVIGRRGSGKTSLTRFFNFQDTYKNACCIDVDEPAEYEQVLTEVSIASGSTTEYAISKLVSIWEHVIWCIIFDELKDVSLTIKKAAFIRNKKTSFARLIRDVLSGILNKITSSSKTSSSLENYLESETFLDAKNEALEYLQKNPLFVAIDSLERYDVQNEPLMEATAALIEAAKKFNLRYSNKNLFIKVFISAEIFPYISEQYIDNSLKYISQAVYLHWRPRDLVRFISWRLYKHVESLGRQIPSHILTLDWEDFDQVFKMVWLPYFGDTLLSREKLSERIFPYILRHTQMRPRQLVVLCNAIAKQAASAIPSADPSKIIPLAIHNNERNLATEVINSYSKVYENVGTIITALSGEPMIFSGKHLDKVAPKTASAWTEEYSPLRFRQLVAELGVVGKIRSGNEKTRIISADFEYNKDDRLTINDTTNCVVHPMFYRKLSINTEAKWIVYPFPDHDDYKIIHGN